nr:L-serine ammonia-lyase [Mesorhizobium sp. WR6]
MLVGLCDLFKIGIGPSSSHTMGPMTAAARFITGLGPTLGDVRRLQATAFGSLAWTGKGHATDRAIILGLAGQLPETVTPERADLLLKAIDEAGAIAPPEGLPIPFDARRDIVFDKSRRFSRHPNAMLFEAFDHAASRLVSELWYSVGGGFVELDGAIISTTPKIVLPFDVSHASELLALCRSRKCSIVDVAAANEDARRPRAMTYKAIDDVASAMFECIERGLAAEGELPGGLRVQRRARALFAKLSRGSEEKGAASNAAIHFLPAFAMAVNEENAAGHRIVTAPTNGAAGVVPAVLRYYRDFCAGSDQGGIRRFFLAATIVGAIIKLNASISGAEVGCQGEVGSAAAMAAAGLVAALGGSNEQAENAAEIAIEHHLGMTCDPVGGLVQIPCIERNAFGAVKAVAAAMLAMQETESHRVSLDQAIETMRQTGADMNSKYRETSRGGLAANVPEC